MLLGTSVLRHYYHDYFCTWWLYDICTSPARCLISWLLFTVLFYGYYLLAFSVALQLARELGFSMLEAVCVFVVGRDEGGCSRSAQSVLTYQALSFLWQDIFQLRFCMKRTYFICVWLLALGFSSHWKSGVITLHPMWDALCVITLHSAG
jgi:hypothetical protein